MSAPCPKCDGTGIAWVDDVLEPCDECDGTGRAISVSPMAVETDDEGRDEE